MKETICMNIMLIGPRKGGKTVFEKAFMDGQFEQEYIRNDLQNTAECDIELGDYKVEFCFNDIPGGLFDSLTTKEADKPSFFSSAPIHLFFVRKDDEKMLTKTIETLKHVNYNEEWKGELSAIILTCDDLNEDSNCSEKAKRFADENGMLFYKISSKDILVTKMVIESIAREYLSVSGYDEKKKGKHCEIV